MASHQMQPSEPCFSDRVDSISSLNAACDPPATFCSAEELAEAVEGLQLPVERRGVISIGARIELGLDMVMSALSTLPFPARSEVLAAIFDRLLPGT